MAVKQNRFASSSKYTMTFNLKDLPDFVKVELRKSDLIDFAQHIIRQTLSNSSIQPKNSDEILDIEAASILTGFAKQTLYALTSQRQIPHFKRGKFIRFRRDELEKWMLENRQKTLTEIKSEQSFKIKK